MIIASRWNDLFSAPNGIASGVRALTLCPLLCFPFFDTTVKKDIPFIVLPRTVYLIPTVQYGWPALPRKNFSSCSVDGGFLCCIFGATMYVYFSSTYSRIGSKRDRHTTGMIIISAIMFFIASFHLGMNAFRLLRGYADERLAPGGPVGYLGVLRKWDHILKDTLYATQENLGSAAAIYRCWVLWNFNWKVIMLPTILLFTNIAAGYVVCGTYPSIDPTASIFNPVLLQWIKTFYAIAVVLNVMTTGLMSYRIWMAHRNSASYVVGKGRLLSIIRILIESAALQLVVEIVLLALYTANLNAQYILLECVTPTVAITFNTITVRIKLQSVATARSKSMHSTDVTNPVQTIGSLPMKRIHVNIDRETDRDTQATSYDDKTNAV